MNTDKKKEIKSDKTSFSQINHNKFEEPNVDDINNINNLDNLSDSEENKFENNTNNKGFTPEASMIRLEKLPNNIREIYRNINIATCFDVFLFTLKKRCENSYDNIYEEMWTHNTYKLCIRFKNSHLSDSNEKEDISSEFIEYMSNTPIVAILQTFNDISQINGYNAKLKLEKIENSKSPSNIIEEARQVYFICKDLYHNFVDLYRYCTGTWNPLKKKKSQKNNLRSEFKHYQDNNAPKNFRRNNNDGSKDERTNGSKDERINYSNGSFQRFKERMPVNNQYHDNYQNEPQNSFNNEPLPNRGRSGSTSPTRRTNKSNYGFNKFNSRNYDDFDGRNKTTNSRNHDNFDERNEISRNVSRNNTNRGRGSFKPRTNNSMSGEGVNGGFRTKHK